MSKEIQNNEFDMGTFKYGIPLGCYCFSSAMLADREVRKEALPFDWLFTNPLEVADIIKTDFIHYLDKDQYTDIADVAPLHGGRQAGHKRYHKNFFNHKNPRNDEDYQYSVRCVERFRKMMKSTEKKLFVVSYRSGINPHDGKHENEGLDESQITKELLVLDKVLKSHTKNYSIFCSVNYKSTSKFSDYTLKKLSPHIILHTFYSIDLNHGLGYGTLNDEITFNTVFDSIIKFK
jgi:hypothetical protein